MDYIVEIAKNGSPTASVITDGKQRYVHSRFVPEKEADIFEQSGQDLSAKVVLVFGLCLGYHLIGKGERLKQAKHLFVIDPLALPEKQDAIKGLDWLNSEDVRVFSGENTTSVAKEIAQFAFTSGNSLIVLRHLPSVKIFPQYFSDLENKLNETLSQLVSAGKTINHFAATFFRNGCKRLSKHANMKDFSLMKGLFAGMDAIVVSSGPSLDAYIDEIFVVREHYVLIAVDSALPVLQANNIDADIIVTVDPQVWVSEHIRESNGIFIESFSSHMGQGQRGDTGQFLLFNTHPLSQISAHFYQSEVHPTTANVAGDALYCALYLGFNRIWLCGMDYSFPNCSIYAKKSAYYQRFGFVNNRFSTILTKEMQYIRKGKVLREEGIRTRHSFIDYKVKTEALIAEKASGHEIFHLVKEGLCLKGATLARAISYPKDCFSEGQGRDTTVSEKRNSVKAILSAIPPFGADKKKAAKLKEWLMAEDVRSLLFEQAKINRDKYEAVFDYFLNYI